MVTKRCSWGTCNSDSRYKDRPHMNNVVFYPFPKPKLSTERCKLWIKRCNRPSSSLSVNRIRSHHFVCSKHFPVGATDPVSACPHGLASSTPNRKRPADRSLLTSPQPKKTAAPLTFENSSEQTNPGNIPDFDVISDEQRDDHSTSSTNCFYSSNLYHKNTDTDDLINDGSKRLNFLEMVIKDDKSCFYYTGIPSLALLHGLFDWLEPAAKSSTLWDGKNRGKAGRKGGRTRSRDSLFKEYVLCLVKIRNGFSNQHLSFLFSMSVSHVSRIFVAWVNLLHQCLHSLLVWHSKETVKGNLPQSFSRYPRTRAIIDCTEYFVQKPLRPAAQKATWSNYKHSNTLKQLVCISPSGTITYLSNVYPGSISDVAIVKACRFVDLVEEGDDIMADRGFNIRHLLLPKKATLNIPAFSHGKVLSHKAVSASRKIASVRIHVERGIRRMKTFKILCGIIPLKLRFLLQQITTIVAVLCNLQPCLA